MSETAFALVVEVPGGLPSTLPNTLEKALAGAVLADGFLVFPLDSMLRLKGGESVTTPGFIKALISLGGGSVRLSAWSGSLRSLYGILYGDSL